MKTIVSIYSKRAERNPDKAHKLDKTLTRIKLGQKDPQTPSAERKKLDWKPETSIQATYPIDRQATLKYKTKTIVKHRQHHRSWSLKRKNKFKKKHKMINNSGAND
jgi:hypothetical protein